MEIPKYPSIRYPSSDEAKGLLDNGTTVEITEKLDGANIRFAINDGELIIGSRNHTYGVGEDHAELEDFPSAFEHARDWLARYFIPDALDEPERWVFYGESMHEHTITYDAFEGRHPDPQEKFPANVLVFDIYDRETEQFVDRGKFLELAGDTLLETVPHFGTRPASSIREEGVSVPQSRLRETDNDADMAFDADGLAEGVVLRNIDTGARAKMVHDSFREQHRSPSSSSSIPSTPAEQFVETYLTDARIRKEMHKLVDEGHFDGLTMEMMTELPRRVITDAVEENAWGIMNDDIDLDTDSKGEIRSVASKQCVRVLKDEVQSI
ncbi:RNA ligase family protein [Halosegnis longus]|uniref:RNA ligase family protein n=1 Tax=Halosegnis longus TaxID=2216012 RepID=UPI00129E13FD|nr:RNA ligase family protein [Halosegnis longus]